MSVEKGTTKVYIIRHGETAWNKEGRLQGQHDPPLNTLGNEQAREVAAYLSKGLLGKIEAVYTSDLVSMKSNTQLKLFSRTEYDRTVSCATH